MKTAKHVFIHAPAFDRIAYPPGCPFKSERAGQVRQLLTSMGLFSGDDRAALEAAPLSRDELAQFHAPEYLDLLRRAEGGDLGVAALAAGLGTGDTPIFSGMCEYAATACGATVMAAELLLAGEAEVACNFSGGYHHAHHARAGGFCYLNDVVLGCQRLAAAGKRVAFVDIDAHHCDGVQAAFYRRNEVMTISLHESGRTLFPGTGFADEIGAGPGRGYTVNLPLPPGIYDGAYLRAYDAVVPDLLAAFAPDFLVIEAGTDALADDPLTHLCLTNHVHARIVRDLLAMGKPMVVTGGGGYHEANTVRTWALLWSIICGDDAGEDAIAGMGGVFLQSTDWLSGLRDRARALPPAAEKQAVDAAVDAAITEIHSRVFPLHGL